MTPYGLRQMTYQTVELQDGTWDVFCLQTGRSIEICQTKAAAVRAVAIRNAEGRLAAAARDERRSRMSPWKWGAC